jgi:hypothetical protein
MGSDVHQFIPLKKVGTEISPKVSGDTLENISIGQATPAAGTFTELKGTIAELIQPTTDTLTTAELKGTQISNYGQSAENTQTLSTAAKGLNSIIVIAAAGVGAVHLKAGATDKIYLDGVALDDGDKVSLAAPVIGDYFSFFTFQNGVGVYDWHVISGIGTLTDGGV